MNIFKRLGALIVLLLCWSVQAQQLDYREVQLGQLDSAQIVTLSSLDSGKPTYIKFWATWCQPCMQQMPHFEALQQKFKNKVDFVAVNININEERAKIDEVIARFGLSMPVLLDNEGQLGLELGLVGTPYSVLLNSEGEVVYTTHESDANLDRFLSMLAKGHKLSSATTNAIGDEEKQALLAPWQKGEHLLFFTATWCDWYLLDSRPGMAQQCKQVQNGLNGLQQRLPNKPWHGFVNHLWTDEQALTEFNQLYHMQVPFSIDTAGTLFTEFNIRSIPMLIRVKDGKVTARISDFSNQDVVIKQLSTD
ncbi:redoxin family protein [Shewanella sp. CG12_big_fil_rev_8_21_14_0_65_47_15]|uniref:TlpA family protein disulfide reductase n=1 Tax=Shewanella sp. CG12_big_fil_rev_8_21_14_0_65_47_15 TaxID=1975537 RepID=UPI000CB3735E|nr:redoxin family protein [Shewanella sp. CG12_big_fil_rev_8_21_14_0_65_47_15]PIW59066.1 MAG: redoxin [Shewanella sp. CG12_big_fil_rev_8_21_14_0_65_47_15]